jgi:ribosomal protein S13
MQPASFQYILRILNTNVDGRTSEPSGPLERALALTAARARARWRLRLAASPWRRPAFAPQRVRPLSPLCAAARSPGPARRPPCLPACPAEVMYALTAIPGVGRRISNVICKKAEIEMTKRAGELTPDEIEKVVAILQDPKKFNIPMWMVNRRRDKFDGKSSQLVSNQIASKLRDDLEHLKKVRAHRG